MTNMRNLIKRFQPEEEEKQLVVAASKRYQKKVDFFILNDHHKSAQFRFHIILWELSWTFYPAVQPSELNENTEERWIDMIFLPPTWNIKNLATGRCLIDDRETLSTIKPSFKQLQ